jgi:pyruvate dehydrogenase E1 component alpha subunit
MVNFNKKKLNKIEQNIYYHLKLVRLVQKEMIKRYHPSDKMKCPMHFCTGQEIMPAAINSLLNKNYSHHRSHGYFLCKKGSLNKMVAEFYGKKTGTNGGLAGSQELSEPDISFYSGTILSGALAMGVGDAFAKKYKSKNSINISVIGDGGMEEGIVTESINMASLYKLPVIFICENNIYSTHTHIKDRVSKTDIIKKIQPYGIKTTKIKSNNPILVYKIMQKVIKDARKNKPQFVEIETYRFGSHVGPEEDDHYNYRPIKERKIWLKNDPLLKLAKILSKNKEFKKFEEKVDKEIMRKIDKAYEFAEKSDFPNKFMQFNYSDKKTNVKKFYENNIPFGSEQEGHKPKPY